MDGATRAVVTLLVITIVGLFIAAILAVYTYSTSAAELPVVIITVVAAILAVVVGLGGSIARHMRGD
jgi:putative Ca2+/H+ antiporter (TMEM165/GDT1 family)